MTTEVDTESTKDSEPASPADESRGEPHERVLDVAEAERYADSIRPSWSDAPPVPAPAPSVRDVVAIGGATRVVRHNTRTDMIAPKLRKHRGSAYLILGASLLGACGVLYLGIASSRVKPNATELARASVKRERPAPVPAPPREVQLAAAEPNPGPAELPGAEQLTAQLTVEDWAADFAAPAPAELPSQEGVESAAASAVNPAATGEGALAVVEPAAAEAPVPAAEVPSAPVAAERPAAASDAHEVAPPPAATQPQVAEAPAAIGAAAAVATAPKQDALEATTAKSAPAAPAQRPKQVLLSLQAYPPNTRLSLDGAQIDNPFRGRLPKSSKHRIEAAAPGFAGESHVLRMEADVQLMLSLKRDQVRDVKADPYRDQRRSASAAPQPTKRDRGAGFVAENPY